MQVKQEILTEWAKLKERGDNKQIASLLGVSEVSASRLSTGGKGSLIHIKKLIKFYEDRKKEIAKLNKFQPQDAD